jgi:hypothetical protein
MYRFRTLKRLRSGQTYRFSRKTPSVRPSYGSLSIGSMLEDILIFIQAIEAKPAIVRARDPALHANNPIDGVYECWAPTSESEVEEALDRQIGKPR